MSRKYYLQCPYCDKRLEREDLVRHIDSKHADELPEGFTPLQVVYHVANNRKFDNPRRCRVCGRPCPWDEKKGRYDQLCGRPECKKKQAENMNGNMGDKLRSNSPTQSAEGLEKMLAGRSISKKYTFSDGTVYTYTGSYEGNLLKWLDSVMEIKSEDLQVPGPTMYYEYNGEKHIYIPDFYYIPYNLIIEVKDGGDRPNTSEARRDSRLKTIAKEKHIVNNTDYNYIRLTNNDFSQLLAVFADLKMNLVEARQSRIVHINEHMAQTSIAPVVGAVGNNDVVLVNYSYNRAFGGEEIALATSNDLSNLFGINKSGKLDRIDKRMIESYITSSYIVSGARGKVDKFLSENVNTEMDSDRIYEAVFDHQRTVTDQILFEEGVHPCALAEGLFSGKKDKVYLSDFRKVKYTKDTEDKYNIVHTDEDKMDGYYFLDTKGKVIFAALLLKKDGTFGRRELVYFTPFNAKAGKDAPFWNELGELVIKDMRCSLYIVTYNTNNNSLGIKEIEKIVLENPKYKCLIDNGMKSVLWPKFAKEFGYDYAWCLYTGSKPDLNANID